METDHILIHGDCRQMSMIPNESVQLIVTSPPYWQLKDYGVANQIGFNDTYEEYINNLNIVWKECYRVLEKGCRLCINVGDQFARSVYYGRYKVIPIHSEIIRFCEVIGFDYMGDIIWQKPTSMHTTGGGNVMGTFPYPRGGIVKIDYEHILIFKKQGASSRPSDDIKEMSKLTVDEWNLYFNSHWTFGGSSQDRHIAVFPEELPKRLIRMFSYVGDTVLDPFMGSGTTALAARNLYRNSIGYELNADYRVFYEQKVLDSKGGGVCAFDFRDDCSVIDNKSLMDGLPYRFKDVHKLDKRVNVKSNTYGSKFEVDPSVIRRMAGSVTSSKKDRISSSNLVGESMVLVNHSRKELRSLMIEKGICYLRAGNSKGSVLVEPGFERVQYVLLHTAGNNPQLFKLKSRGSFQIWTKETLQEKGFNPQNAAYYMVFHFDNKPLPLSSCPDLKDSINTFRVKIKSIKEFNRNQQ